jgi:hypothetical protein
MRFLARIGEDAEVGALFETKPAGILSAQAESLQWISPELDVGLVLVKGPDDKRGVAEFAVCIGLFVGHVSE